MKRKIAFLLVAALLFACSGCAEKIEEASLPSSSNSPAEPETPGQLNAGVPATAAGKGFDLIGLVIDDDGSDRAYMTMYGFLDEAIADDVNALLVFDPTCESDAAIGRAAENGIKVVVPYYESSAVGLDANIIADTSEYYDELARGLAERMTERSLKSGRILVYGADTAACYAAFSASIASAYPQFRVEAFDRTAVDEQGAIDELATYLLYNRDIKGMYVVDSEAASIAIQARSKAQKTFRAEGAPSPTPEPTPAPGMTPEPTPNPGLLTQITITVFCNGLSDDNYGLFSDNDIYALCIEPYYEAAAEATMALDKLLRGDTVPPVSRVNRPIIYGDTADKYKAIFEQMKALFNIT